VPIVAAIRNEEQYPTVGEFTVLLAEDHAKPEFTHALADLLDRFASHLGATPASDPLAQAPGAGTTARRALQRELRRRCSLRQQTLQAGHPKAPHGQAHRRCN